MIPLLPFYAEKLGASPERSRLADRDLRGLPAVFRSSAGPPVGSHRAQAAAAGEPGGNLRRISDHGVCAVAVDLVCGARHRRVHGRESFSRAGLHLGRHRAQGSREIVRHHRHRLRPGVPDRTGDFRIARQVRLSLSDLRRRGAVGHQHPDYVSSVAGGQPAGAGKGHRGPGGKRLSLVQWGAYAEYFRQPSSGDEAVAVFQFCVRLLDVHRGHAAGSRTPADLGRQAFWSGTGRLHLGLRRIVGNLSAGTRAWADW